MLDRLQATFKTGNEPLTCNGKTLRFSLLDFWKWSVSDLLSNATRGRLAEFIVATACNMEMIKVREEWDAYDLETPDSIKIEVKSSAYLQSWYQKTLSKISFSIRMKGYWDAATNKLNPDKGRQADVYVFCLLHYQDKYTVDPLNMDQWEFYVLATKEVNEYKRSKHSITLKSLQALTPSVRYEHLHEAIERKNELT